MEKGKTIKQIADELGVSKQAVQKRIAREPLRSSVYAYIDKVGGVLYIAYTGEMLIKQAFSGGDRIQVADNQADNLYTHLYTSETPLYDILKGELEAKNKQIEELTAELAKEREHSREQSERMAVLADQAQKLQLAQMKPQLTDGGADPQAETPPQEKPSLFHRLFGKEK